MQIEDLRDSLQKMEVISSNKYISFMVQVCAKLNSSPASQVQRVDISDLQSGDSNLIFIQLKNIKKPLAVDLQYISRLRVELQDTFLAQLNRHISMLPLNTKELVKEITAKFNKLQKNTSVSNLKTFVNPETYLQPINEMLEKAENIGGNAEVDYIFDALNISSEKRFDCAYLVSVLSNQLDPYRDNIIQSLKNISEVKSPDKYLQFLRQNLELLQSQTDTIYKTLREKYNIQMNLDENVANSQTDWFKLDVPTDSHKNLFNFIFNFKDDASLIEKTYFDDKKEDISASNLKMEFNSIDNDETEKELNETIKVFEKTKEAMNLSTDKNGSLLSVIEQKKKWGEIEDNEYLSIIEWLDTNGKQCLNLLLAIYKKLVELKDKNDKFQLPPYIYEIYENSLKIREKEINDLKKEVNEVLKKADESILENKFKEIEELKNTINKSSLEKNHEIISTLETLQEELSPSNIFLIEKIELVFDEDEAAERILGLWDFSKKINEYLNKSKSVYIEMAESLPLNDISDFLYTEFITYTKEKIMREIRDLDFSSMLASSIKEKLNENDINYLSKIKDIIGILPENVIIFTEIDSRIDKKEITLEEGKEKKAMLEANSIELLELKKEIERQIRDEIIKNPNSVGKDTRMSVYGLDTIIPDRLLYAAKKFNIEVKKASNLEEIKKLSENIKLFEETVIKNQKMAEAGGEFYKKIESQLEHKLISEQLANSLKNDISSFYLNVKEILKQLSKNQTELAIYLRKMENRMTGIKHFDDESHNELTIDITDIEELDKIYSFTKDVTVERKKKFCKIWDLRRNNLLEYMEKHKGDTIYNVFVSDDLVADYDSRNIISTATKAAIYHESNNIFEDECTFVLVGAELIDHKKFHHKKLFQNFVHYFIFILKDKNYGRKEFNLFFGKIQTLIKKYQPEQKNDVFKHNSSRLLSELLKLF